MDDRARQIARGMIIKHEGFSEKPYRDSMGFLTIGYGHCLDFRPVSQQAALVMLDDDLDWFINAMKKTSPIFNSLDIVRQAVLVDMAFNLGLLGIMKFKVMWKAIENGDWDAAAEAMLASRWREQVGQRAFDCAEAMRTGMVPEMQRKDDQQ